MENHTDLAVECYESKNKTKLEGVKVSEENGVTTVEVLNEKGAQAIGKPVGRYVTCTVPSFVNDTDIFDGRLERTAGILKTLLPEKLSSVLVACIGNHSITADALGPKCRDYILATRHIINDGTLDFSKKLMSVSAVATGVLGDTGIESAEFIKGLVNEVNPSCVIAVDALAASSPERLGTTVQFSDTGIIPGSGVGNHRYEISPSTLGIPVVSVGIPTVISSSLLGSSGEPMFVTPREIDRVTEQGAKLIGMSVNVCLQKGFSAQELFSLVG
ncbi:MAG: GPR endopeptidase [Eubacterium sp.]|nr:GPR endopeptidase [Eubacterium sp.]